jgi:hypothetical protein
LSGTHKNPFESLYLKDNRFGDKYPLGGRNVKDDRNFVTPNRDLFSNNTTLDTAARFL